MPRGSKLASLTLTDEQQNQLQGIAQSATRPYALVVRARIILASAEGLTNVAVAKRVGVTPHTVGKWRRRFRAAGIEGLHDELRPGRPRTYDDDKVAAVISRALQEKPDAATHWSTRTLGRAEGIAKSTVQRWLALFGVKPHLAQTFKLSTDPFFIEKVRDIVGLYLNPPDHAMVLCVDEKSQIQALNRTQPTLPMGLGYDAWHRYTMPRVGSVPRRPSSGLLPAAACRPSAMYPASVMGKSVDGRLHRGSEVAPRRRRLTSDRVPDAGPRSSPGLPGGSMLLGRSFER